MTDGFGTFSHQCFLKHTIRLIFATGLMWRIRSRRLDHVSAANLAHDSLSAGGSGIKHSAPGQTGGHRNPQNPVILSSGPTVQSIIPKLQLTQSVYQTSLISHTKKKKMETFSWLLNMFCLSGQSRNRPPTHGELCVRPWFGKEGRPRRRNEGKSVAYD